MARVAGGPCSFLGDLGTAWGIKSQPGGRGAAGRHRDCLGAPGGRGDGEGRQEGRKAQGRWDGWPRGGKEGEAERRWRRLRGGRMAEGRWGGREEPEQQPEGRGAPEGRRKG